MIVIAATLRSEGRNLEVDAEPDTPRVCQTRQPTSHRVAPEFPSGRRKDLRKHALLRALHERVRPRTYFEIGVREGQSLGSPGPERRRRPLLRAHRGAPAATCTWCGRRATSSSHAAPVRPPPDPDRPRVHRRDAPRRVRPARLHQHRAVLPPGQRHRDRRHAAPERRRGRPADRVGKPPSTAPGPATSTRCWRSCANKAQPARYWRWTRGPPARSSSCGRTLRTRSLSRSLRRSGPPSLRTHRTYLHRPSAVAVP